MPGSGQRQTDAAAPGKPLPTPHVPRRTEKTAWTVRFARFSRWLHKWVGTVLALIMVALSITGGLVAFKNELEYLQPATRSGGKGDITAVIPPA